MPSKKLRASRSRSVLTPTMCILLVMNYYHALDSAVRKGMATEGIACASAKTLVAGRTLRRGVQVKAKAKS